MNKLTIKIFDNNFRPNISASKCGIPKYINWQFVTKESDLIKDDIVFYTDQYLHIAKNHNVKKKIAWILEPPVIHNYPYKYIQEHREEFDAVFTVLLNYDSLYIPNIMTYIEQDDRKLHIKSKLISLIFSTKNKSKNHKFRQDIVNLISDLNLNVDMFGAIVNKYIESKIDTLKDYMFHIVVENCNHEGYYSEKTLDCFLTGTIPIIYKSSYTIHEYDTNGIIIFASLNELKQIINMLSIDEYHKRIDSVRNNFNKAMKYITPEDYLYEKYYDVIV